MIFKYFKQTLHAVAVLSLFLAASPLLAEQEGQTVSLPIENLKKDIQGANFREAWSDLTEVAEDYSDVIAGKDDSWFNRRTKSFVAEAFDVVCSNIGLKAYEKILELQEDIQDNSKKMEELKANRISYPDTSANPFAMTRKKCDEKLKELQQDNENLEQTIEEQTTVLEKDLNRYGKIIERKYLEHLLVAVEGENVLQLISTSTLLKQMQFAINEQLKAEPTFNAVQIERYTGLYLVILNGWKYAHELGIKNIEDVYLPKLKTIMKEAVNQAEEAQRLIEEVPNATASLKANIRINENTFTVAKAYLEILVAKKQDLQESLKKVNSQVKVAQNTYNTVKTGAGLLKLINDSMLDYEAIMNFDPPLLDTLYEDKFSDAFQQVSAKLREK